MEAKTRILLVDDDPGLTAPLGAFLERAGFQVAVAVNGADALDQIKSFGPHLVLLDILMPWMDGHELLRQLRQAGNWTPVIMLTTIDATAERTLSLNEGADDYVNKPFDPNELLARIGAVLRRVRPGQAPLAGADQLASGPLRLNRRARMAYLRDKPLTLSSKAVSVLEYLMTHRDEVISRERLLEVLWDISSPIGTRAVDARIAELRRALGDERAAPRFIETIRSIGYRFIGHVEAVP